VSGPETNGRVGPEIRPEGGWERLVDAAGGEAGAVAALRRETLAWVATELGSSLDAESHAIEDLSRMRELVAMLVALDPRENDWPSEARRVAR
jgi:hypothetical protein